MSVNGDNHLPMQSVFKFQIVLALLAEIDKNKFTLDQKITVTKKDLLPDTWSPIRKEFPTGNQSVT